jgi:nucleotide-binding universal stress UspA family protein
MEKLTRIMAIVERAEDGAVVVDKAIALARRFHARVELLITETVLMQPLAALCAVKEYDEVTLCSMQRSGEPIHESILRRVLMSRPDLILKASAGNHPLRRLSLTENDWQLANESPVPVLLVGHRKWAQPTRFAAAISVDDDEAKRVTRRILHTAGFLALGCRGNLDLLYSEREQHDERLRMERAVQVAQLVREFHVGCERLQMFSGAPETTLPPLAASREYDVLVLGTDGEGGGIASAIRGDLASRMIEASDSDVVLVRAISSAARNGGEADSSPSKQRFNEAEEIV